MGRVGRPAFALLPGLAGARAAAPARASDPDLVVATVKLDGGVRVSKIIGNPS